VILIAVKGAVLAIDGLSAAPAGVADALCADDPFGGHTVGVPGVLRAMELAHCRFGRLPWPQLFEPAIGLAAGGFPVAPYLARTLRDIPALYDENLARTLFCNGTDRPLPIGRRVRNPALARVLRSVAEGGADVFYIGEVAHDIARAVRNGLACGCLAVSDLAAYRAVDRAPIRFQVGDHTVCSGGLPAMGGVAVGQIAGIAARLGVDGIGRDLSADEIDVLAAAGRAAFEHRPVYGDPDFVPVDAAGLLDPAYLDERALQLKRTGCRECVAADGQTRGGSMTSHICVADTAGTVVSMTTTINQNFGAHLNVGGFYLNNALTNFAVRPMSRGRRLANAMAPRKRPRTTIAPCIVLDSAGRPVAAIGAGGGYRIIGYVANGLLRLAAGERDPQALVAAPHALNWGGLTELEPPLGRHARALAERGHRTRTRRLDGGAQCLLIGADGVAAGGDTRRDGAAMAMHD
jgi:gamma-glutamyltranspeptidase/glutathione hydrolase